MLVTNRQGAWLLGGVAHGAILLGGEVVWRRATEVIAPPSGVLDPVTTEFLFVPFSSQHNLLDSAWENGSSLAHTYASDFRPEFTGSGNGYRIDSGWAPPHEWTLDRLWTEFIFNPATDLHSVKKPVLVISLGGVTIPEPYAFTDNAAYVELARTLEIYQEMVAVQLPEAEGIIIDGLPRELLDTSQGGDDTAWRATIDPAERHFNWIADRLRAWLDSLGHTSVWVRVFPRHRLAARLYDDAQAGLIPGGITSDRAFRSGWGEGIAYSPYMLNRRGSWAMNCLWRRFAFGSQVSTLPLVSGQVDQVLADYIDGICADILADYPHAGLGGTGPEEPGVILYDGETFADIMPGATTHVIDFTTATIYSDRAGTIAATAGGPVGRIVTADGLTFTAVNDTDRPVLRADGWIDFTNDTLPGVLPDAITPVYIAAVMQLIPVTSDNALFNVGSYELRHIGGGYSIGVETDAGQVGAQVNTWGDVPALLEVIASGGVTAARATNCAYIEGAIKVSGGSFNRPAPVSGSAMTVGGNSWYPGNPNVTRTLQFYVADQVPTLEQQVRIRKMIGASTGLAVWDQ